MPSSGRRPPLRVLVMGGTGFVSGAVAREAVARGHDVTCVARGTGTSLPEGARLLRADRNAPNALAPLRDVRFDAAVETAIRRIRPPIESNQLVAQTSHDRSYNARVPQREEGNAFMRRWPAA